MMVLAWLEQPSNQVLLLAVLTACLLLVLLAQGRRQRKLKQEMTLLKQAQAQLIERFEALQQAPPAAPTPAPLPFSAQLQQVEQQPDRPLATPRTASEKYRYVAALAEQGMTAAQIAQALRISEAEAEQTIRLAQLSEGSG